MTPAAAAAIHWLDVVFAFWIRSTVQLSLVVLLVLTARAVLRRWMAPGARYALWLLPAVPLIAALLPLPAVTLPATFQHASLPPAAPSPRPSSVAPAAGALARKAQAYRPARGGAAGVSAAGRA